MRGITLSSCRGAVGSTIFFDPKDSNEVYRLLAEGSARFEYRGHAYVLMSNPLHFAVEVDRIPLARGMQNLEFGILQRQSDHRAKQINGSSKGRLMKAPIRSTRATPYY